VSVAVFLDKDGTLVEDVPYNVDPRFVRFMPRAVDGLRELQRAGYRLFVVTNQSGVARGYFDEDAIRAVGSYITQTLASEGVALDAFYFCPHLPEGVVEAYSISCGCRKPEAGLILEAAERHGIDLSRSWFVGDIASDIEAGRRAGCRTVLVAAGSQIDREVRSGNEPDLIVPDLLEAARAIAGRETGHGAPPGPEEVAA